MTDALKRQIKELKERMSQARQILDDTGETQLSPLEPQSQTRETSRVQQTSVEPQQTSIEPHRHQQEQPTAEEHREGNLSSVVQAGGCYK